MGSIEKFRTRDSSTASRELLAQSRKPAAHAAWPRHRRGRPVAAARGPPRGTRRGWTDRWTPRRTARAAVRRSGQRRDIHIDSITSRRHAPHRVAR